MAQVVEAQVSPDGARLAVGGTDVPVTAARFAPTCDGLVYGVALNHRDSLEALGGALSQPPYAAPPRAPVVYVKPWNTHAAHGATIALPRGAREVEVLATLGVMIGTQCTHVRAAQALEHVRGYTLVADLSLPQSSLYRPPIREKCFDGSCPVGPWMVSREEIVDPAALELRVTVSGEPAQRFDLRKLVRPLPRLIADVTEFMTLYPGDVLLAGVRHEGPRAGPGQRVSVSIDAVGELAFAIAEAAA
jgi:5-oxopent-3-ene-1,2,5-tricarboxylate decarboxylase/2-hydroxyhepta-2,4-diene-1,7-dioate isomerase